VAQIVVLPKDLKSREALRLKIVDVFKNDFPEVRGRVKMLPNGPPVPYPVQFRVAGPEVDVVRVIADEVKQVMRGNPNALGVNDNWNESIKVLRLDLDQDRLRALGISSQTVMRAANTILTGTPVGQFRDDDKLIDIVIRQPVEERSTISALDNASIPTPNGRSVPMSHVARAQFVWEPGVVWREGREWAITVQSDVIDGIQGPTVSSQIDPQLAKLRAAPARPSGPVRNTSTEREKLCSCSISSVKMMNTTSGTLTAIESCALPLSAAAPASSIR
jgi:multidrug efflux pump